MFTGIVETLAKVQRIENEGTNKHFWFEANISQELKIDQSVAHNGVCLTVVGFQDGAYKVTAIKETLDKTNLNALIAGDFVNLERCMKLGDRLDGHIVQGHVDQVGECLSVSENNGSWTYTFKYDFSTKNITIEKGSITVNGTSLTVVDSKKDSFSVCIIPYTFEHTVFKFIKPGTIVNLEFDVIGKYVQRLQNLN